MTAITLHHPVFVIVAGLTAIGWLVYLTVMLYEHRRTLREMGGSIR